MPDRLASLIIAGMTALCPPAHAQGSDGLVRTVELAAHRRLIATMSLPGAHPDAFETDGCSGGLSASWSAAARVVREFALHHEAQPPWEDCCVTHDHVYHGAAEARTAEASYGARLAADLELKACVIATGEARLDQLAESYGLTPDQVRAAYAVGADAIFASVRLGGGPCTGLPWRWGYGFENCP